MKRNISKAGKLRFLRRSPARTFVEGKLKQHFIVSLVPPIAPDSYRDGAIGIVSFWIKPKENKKNPLIRIS